MSVIQKLILLIIFIITFQGCTDKDNHKRILKSQGYTNIELSSVPAVMCDNSDYPDFWRTSFTATSPNGTIVKGNVCEGLMSGAIIRLR